MEVSVTKSSDGRTQIKLQHNAYGNIGTNNEKRFKVYTPGGDSYTITTGLVGVGATLTYSFYIEDYPDYFIKPLTNTAQGTFRVALEGRYVLFGNTVIDWNQVQKNEYSFSIYNNDYTRPTISMSITPTALSNGYNMVGITAIQATFSGGGKYGASISSYNLSVDGKNYGAPYKSDLLKNGGWQNVVGTVTDSRGFTASVNQKIWVMANMPSLNSFSGDTAYLDGALKFNFTPPNQDAYSRIVISSKVGNNYEAVKNVDLGQGAGGTKSYTLSSSELATVYERYPNTTSVSLRLTLLTYKEAYADKLSEEYYKDLTLSIPENNDTKPQVNTITAVGSPTLFNASDIFVKGKNGAKITATGSGRYKASITKIEWSVENEVFSNDKASDNFATFGSLPVTVYITDSRGFTNSKVTSISVYDYQKPTVSAISGATTIVARRVNQSGQAADDGSYLRLEAGKKWSLVGGKNKCNLRYRKKVTGKDTNFGEYETLLEATSATNDYTATLNEALDPQTLYTIELSATDSFGEVGIYTVYIATEKVFMDRSGERGSIAYGGHVTEDNAFEVYQDAYFRGAMIIDDVASGSRYRITISDDGTLKATLDNQTYNLRR